MYLYWSDVDFNKGTLRVTAKPEFDFTVKDYEERTVAVPHDNLMGELFKLGWWYNHSESTPRKQCQLVFPTAGAKPNYHMLRLCKRIAHRAGLNCKMCETCVSTKGKECERWFLHKFRATYGTELLRMGFDIATVRKLLGHKPGSEATFRYLAPLQIETVRKKGIDQLFDSIVGWEIDRDTENAQKEEPERVTTNSEAAISLASEEANLLETPEASQEGISDIWNEVKEALRKAQN